MRVVTKTVVASLLWRPLPRYRQMCHHNLCQRRRHRVQSKTLISWVEAPRSHHLQPLLQNQNRSRNLLLRRVSTRRLRRSPSRNPCRHQWARLISRGWAALVGRRRRHRQVYLQAVAQASTAWQAQRAQQVSRWQRQVSTGTRQRHRLRRLTPLQ